MKYGFKITWHRKPLETQTVEMNDYDSAEEAYAKTLAITVAYGYTKPRWWQWWRWSEQRYSMEAALTWFYHNTIVETTTDEE